MAIAIQAKAKVMAMGSVMDSPEQRPTKRVIDGDVYMSMPAIVMGTPFTPAENSIMGTAVTMPVRGNNNHCHPWRWPVAPMPFASLHKMKSNESGTIEKDSMNTET